MIAGKNNIPMKSNAKGCKLKNMLWRSTLDVCYMAHVLHKMILGMRN